MKSPKFMLPIRLGTVNAAGPQELFLFTLTRNGRVETANYRTVKIPSDVEIPLYIKSSFSAFYKSMFDRAVEREDMRVVFQEYAWDLGWCDPCAADPLPVASLRKLGAFWLPNSTAPIVGQGQAFATRLHLRYDRAHFPEDLMLIETRDTSTFQGRYILRHPFLGKPTCEQAEEYHRGLADRLRLEATTLSYLTGWQIEDIRKKMETDIGPADGEDAPWWRRIWE